MHTRKNEETFEHSVIAASGGGHGQTEWSQAMNMNFLRRFFRSRNVYWSVVRELSCYSDRELHDLGIDRGDIAGIASAAAHQA
jgi:uncharacterized protein YjiS (DUF1127 family)